MAKALDIYQMHFVIVQVRTLGLELGLESGPDQGFRVSHMPLSCTLLKPPKQTNGYWIAVSLPKLIRCISCVTVCVDHHVERGDELSRPSSSQLTTHNDVDPSLAFQPTAALLQPHHQVDSRPP